MKRRRRIKVEWLIFLLLVLQSTLQQQSVNSLLLLMKTNCLSSFPGCSCSWKGGKFVADCANQSLALVPKNDYYDFLLNNAGNNQMPTLNRDIQQLNLASNNISSLKAGEFYGKKFKNLQKLYLSTNQLFKIHQSAFYKLTGLVELDLSENFLSNFGGDDDDETSLDEFMSDSNSSEETSGNFSINVNSSSKVKVEVIEKKQEKERKRITFLHHLSQLRLLNLASNKITRIEEFTFSPTTQLRQLLLSRNRISFIDKRAFDGLEVLNILHLDGNKLSHLDGDILWRLPKLHALQLAGNEWRCDCKLRKLVRLLVPQSGQAAQALAQSGRRQRAAPTQVEQTIRANILQDQPSCASWRQDEEEPDNQDSIVSLAGSTRELPNGSRPSRDKSRNEEEEDDRQSRAWRDMKLAHFECPPQVAMGFGRWPSNSMGQETLLQQQQQTTDRIGKLVEMAISSTAQVMNMNDKMRGGEERRRRRRNGRVLVSREHYLTNEPIELTCAFTMTDELDLDLVQVEWWQLNGIGIGASGNNNNSGKMVQLMWQSLNGSMVQVEPTTTLQTANKIPSGKLKDEPLAGAVSLRHEELPLMQRSSSSRLIIDYVTRANLSTDAETSPIGQLGNKRNSLDGIGKLVRVVHLVSGPLGREHSISASSKSESDSEFEHQQHKQQPLERLFLCRITNFAGHLDLVSLVSVDSGSVEAQAESKRRQLVRQRARELTQSTSNNWLPNHFLASASTSTLSLPIVERLKLAFLASEVNGSSSSSKEKEKPLFIPIHLPDGFIGAGRVEELGDLEESSLPVESLGRSLSQDGLHQQQRSASTTRQANKTNPLHSLGFNFEPKFDWSHDFGSNSNSIAGSNNKSQKVQSLRAIALSLIDRYTSNSRTLIDGLVLVGEEEKEKFDSEQSEARLGSLIETLSSGDHDQRPLGDRVRALLRLIQARYIETILKFATREAPLLIAVFAGLLAGCILTFLITLRLICARDRVVNATYGDSLAKSATMRELNEGEEEEEDDEMESTDEMNNNNNNKGNNDDNQDVHRGHHLESPPSGNGRMATPNEGGCSDKPVSGGSSSSTTNDCSQRKLLAPSCCPSIVATATIESGPTGSAKRGLQLRDSKVAARLAGGQQRNLPGHTATTSTMCNYDRFVDGSSCQSDEVEEMNGDVSCALDLEDSPNELHHQYLDTANKLAAIHSSQQCNLAVGRQNLPTNFVARSGLEQREPRLIVVTPQQEMQELMLASYYNGLDTNELQLSDADSSLIAPNQSVSCQQVAFTLEPHNCYHSHHQIESNQWLPSSSCGEEVTVEDSSGSSILLTGGSYCHHYPQQQQQQQQQQPATTTECGPPFIVAPPKLRSLDAEALLLPYFLDQGCYASRCHTLRSTGHKLHNRRSGSQANNLEPLRSHTNCSPTVVSSAASTSSSNLTNSNVNQENWPQYSNKVAYFDEALNILQNSIDNCKHN